MDVVASLSYLGQDLCFIDQERYAHAISKGVYIYDTIKGPREIQWRHDKEVRHITANIEKQVMVLSFNGLNQPIEIAKLTDQQNPLFIPNPVQATLVETAISRDGDRLVGLTSVVDHQVIVWELKDNFKSATVLAKKKLDFICEHILINPVDPNQICLYGPDCVGYVYFHELFGVHTLKVKKAFPSPTSKNGISGEKLIDSTTTVIRCCLWLPNDRLWVALSDGGIYEIHTTTMTERFLGSFLDPAVRSTANPSGMVYPTTMAVTSQYLLVGTASGSVFWYGLASTLVETNATVLEAWKIPLRELKVPGPISSLTLDPTYAILICGTTNGHVIKAAIEPDAQPEPDTNKNNDEEQTEVVKKIKTEPVIGTSLGNDCPHGIALSSKFVTISAKRTSSRTKVYLSMFVVGSHDGSVTFWRHNSPSGDIALNSLGIRRSIPRAMQTLLALPRVNHVKALAPTAPSTAAAGASRPATTGANKAATPTANAAAAAAASAASATADGSGDGELKSVCSMEVISFGVGSHVAILCLGLANGMLEQWLLTATELDEEDREANGSTSNVNSTANLLVGGSNIPANGNPFRVTRALEDDEGACPLQLEAILTQPLTMFRTAISSLQVLYPNDGMDVHLAVASAQSPILYIMSIAKHGRLELGKCIAAIDLEHGLSAQGIPLNLPVEDDAVRAKLPVFGIKSVGFMDECVYSFDTRNRAYLHRYNPHSQQQAHVNPTASMLTNVLKFPLSNETLTKHSVCIAAVYLSPLQSSAVLLSTKGVAYFVTFAEESKNKILWEDSCIQPLDGARDTKHLSLVDGAPTTAISPNDAASDLISCVQFAAHGWIFATGAIDGTVTLYRICAPQAIELHHLPEGYPTGAAFVAMGVNRICLNASPVVSLSFSSQSSNTLTVGGVDQGYHILFIGKYNANQHSLGVKRGAGTKASLGGATSGAAGAGGGAGGAGGSAAATALVPVAAVNMVISEDDVSEAAYDRQIHMQQLQAAAQGSDFAAAAASTAYGNDGGDSVAGSASSSSQAAVSHAMQQLTLTMDDRLALEHERGLRAQHKFKCMGISAAIQELQGRLQLLLDQNAARTEIEQLPLEEFVVDLVTKGELERKNLADADALREAYDDRNAFLDLISARIRQRTYDTIESNTIVCVKPFDIPRNLLQETSTTATGGAANANKGGGGGGGGGSGSGANSGANAAEGGTASNIDPKTGQYLDKQAQQYQQQLFMSGISAMPIPKVTPDDAKIIEKVKRLRRLELRSIRRAMEMAIVPAGASGVMQPIRGTADPVVYRSAWTANVQGCPIDNSYLVNDGLLWPLHPKRDDAIAESQGIAKGDTAPGGGGAAATTAGGKGADGKGADGKAAADAKASATAAAASAATAAAAAASNAKAAATNDGGDGAKANGGGGGVAPLTGDAQSLGSQDAAQQEFLLELDSQFDEHQLLNLLYPPQATRSIVQKRNQILFLEEVIRRLQAHFNQRLTAVRSEKEELLQLIDARNTRIVEIMDELYGGSGLDDGADNSGKEKKLSENWKKVWRPRLADEEKLGTAITIGADELTQRPYESAAQREKRLREEAEREAKRQTDPAEAVKQRALVDMMHGTLEVKRDMAAAEALLTSQRPSWLNEKLEALRVLQGSGATAGAAAGTTTESTGATPRPPAAGGTGGGGNQLTTMIAELSMIHANDLNEAQQKEFDAYVTKLKTLQEEQAHYRKSLEQEMKKCKQEVVDHCKAFNDKIEHMTIEKVLAQKDVYTQEMYIAQIAASLVRAERTRTLVHQAKEDFHRVTQTRTSLKEQIDGFQHQLDALHHKIVLVQEEGKAMETTFKRDIQSLCEETFDQETLNQLRVLFKKRRKEKHAAGDDGWDNGAANDASNADISASASRSRASASQSHTNRRSRGGNNSSVMGGNNRSSSQAVKGGASTVVRGHKRPSGGAGKGNNASASAQGGGGGGGNNASTSMALGPMQQAAQALRAMVDVQEQLTNKAKDPYHVATVQRERKLRAWENQLPSSTPLSMEHELQDMPPDFAARMTQFLWSKLQELRHGKLNKEIEEIVLNQEYHEAKEKLTMFQDEEEDLQRQAKQLRAMRDESSKLLHDLDENLDVLVSLLQGQDEVDRDAVATDYGEGLLLPLEVIGKFNKRIKELGAEKIGVLTKIKLFRRKINAMDWEAKHQALQAKHYQSYYTDIQLFRVTRDLQKVIVEGEHAFDQKERVEKISARREYLAKEYQERHASLEEQVRTFRRQIHEKQSEKNHLLEQIQTVEGQVALSQSIKESREQARGGGTAGAATMTSAPTTGHTATGKRLLSQSMPVNVAAMEKMKKVVQRKHLVDMARAQAEEIDFLRQELDRMRQRTFPSFVKATKNRLGGQGY